MGLEQGWNATGRWTRGGLTPVNILEMKSPTMILMESVNQVGMCCKGCLAQGCMVTGNWILSSEW